MKKIMFNDKYGLTEAVLTGRKTKTRRMIPQSELDRAKEFQQYYFDATLDTLTGVELLSQFFLVEKIGKLPYQIGDVVAIAQSYKDAGVHSLPEEDDEFGCYNFPAEQTNGWTNKMFVRADLMPHQIRITNIRIERLQDIGDVDCLSEGIEFSHRAQRFYANRNPTTGSRIWLGDTPREAYAALIDRISDKGTWESNPFVFVYDFKLVK